MATQSADFQTLSRRYTADKGFRAFIQKGLSGYYQKRDQNKANFCLLYTSDAADE